MLENSRFWELGDPGGIVFVRRNRLDNYVATKNFADVKTPSQHPKTRILTIVTIFRQKSLKMLENSRFAQLGDPAGIDFVRKNRLVNYVATRDCYRCENTRSAPES